LPRGKLAAVWLSVDALLIMMAYRHGLRASEIAAPRWDQVDLKAGVLHVARRKNGSPATHPLRGPELRALRGWKRQQKLFPSPYVFTSLRGGPMTIRTIHYVVAEAGKRVGLEFPVHPHMLRHATCFYLANAGQDTRAIQAHLGHKNIQHSVHAFGHLHRQKIDATHDFYRRDNDSYSGHIRIKKSS
jgi:type 1 fimbriae regulatory protein FimB/type 1 fimbriae regulatory protein FimE